MTTIPQCMQCSSYTGEMKGRDFHCKSCGMSTQQPEVVDDPTDEENVIAQMKEEAADISVDWLRRLLEAYDTGEAPFDMESEAKDLQPLIVELFRPILEAQVDIAKAETRVLVEEEQGVYLQERKQALIEMAGDTCLGLPGLSADIIGWIETYIPNE